MNLTIWTEVVAATAALAAVLLVGAGRLSLRSASA